MKQRLALGMLALTMAACRAPVRPATQPSPATGTVEDLVSAIASDAKRSDHESDAQVRARLAEDASRDAQACLASAPQAAACLYGRAVAQGLEARAHPTRAGELLNSMLESLSSAEAADPHYDYAGPARVRSLVLVRAPGWPLGPGDPEAGLAAARRAVALQPAYPANLLALAEALAKNGDAKGARENYDRASEAARALPVSADRDDWLREAAEGAQHTRAD
ncbi:MAG: hypothetical protein M3N97_05430 [Pseudomonadota bacterium]|nr:hypothetical protein [Pseudomonadota bacterium]